MAVSAKDKARWQAIGTALDELNADAPRADAARSVGEKIEAGLDLSGHARSIAQAFDAPVEDKVKPSIPALWKQRRAHRG